MDILFLNKGTQNSEIGAQKLKDAGYTLHSVFFFTGQEDIKNIRTEVDRVVNLYCETHNEYDISFLTTSNETFNLITCLIQSLVLARCKHFGFVGINSIEDFTNIEIIQTKELRSAAYRVEIISTLLL